MNSIKKLKENIPSFLNEIANYYGVLQKPFHITSPKTDAGTRIIPMLSEVKQALLTEYNLQQEFGFCDEVVDGYTGFMFQNRYGIKTIFIH